WNARWNTILLAAWFPPRYSNPSMRRVFLLALLITRAALADYGWIPEYQHLQLRTGVDIFSSGQNYANDSFLDAPRMSGQIINFDDIMFWMRPEFGIAMDWSVGLFLGFSRPTATAIGTGAVLASGSGLMDTWVNAKWHFSKSPHWT